MSTILEANGLKSKRNYQGALALYDKQWEIDQNSFTAWDLKNYAYCARKKSNYEQGIDICNYAYKIFPNFNKIDSDFYWCKFYTTLKCYPDNIEYEDKKELAIKIRDRFKEAVKYSPYNHTCLYMSKLDMNRGHYDGSLEWLSFIDIEELSTDYKFTKENELIYFYPNYLKYYLYKANCYLNLEDYEKCFNQCFLGLRKYSNANGLYYYISKCIPKIYHLEGINLFNHLLALVGFEDDFVRDDYRNALISKSKLIDWKNTEEQDDTWDAQILRLRIGKILFELIEERWMKNKNIESLYAGKDTISSSELGNFVFCAASYSIASTFGTEEKRMTVGDHDLSAKESIFRLSKTCNNEGSILSVINSLNISGEEEALLRYLLNINFTTSNINDFNPKIFISDNGTFLAAPDNLYMGEKNIIVEEKYRILSEKSFDQCFLNHELEILNSEFNIESLNGAEKFVIYWIWSIDKRENRQLEYTYSIKEVKIFRIGNEKERVLNSSVEKLKELKQNKTIGFSKSNTFASKCTGCSNRKMCYHKTGRLNSLEEPYLCKKIPFIQPHIIKDEMDLDPNIGNSYNDEDIPY
jgi:hypothetical protein